MRRMNLVPCVVLGLAAAMVALSTGLASAQTARAATPTLATPAGSINSIVVGPNDDIPGKGLLPLPFTDSVSSYSDLDDVWAFPMELGQYVEFEILTPTDLDPEMLIFGPSAKSIWTATPHASSRIIQPGVKRVEWFCYKTGTYYLDVAALSGYGTYELKGRSYQEDDEIPGRPLPSSDTTGFVADQLETDDVYAVTANPGDTINVSLITTSSLDAVVRIFAPGATKIGVDTPIASKESTNTVKNLSVVAPTSGTYYIDIRGRTGSGEYRLQVGKALKQFAISAVAGPHGTISPSGASTVIWGDDSAAYTFKPADGYHLMGVWVDDVFLGPLSSYTFTKVAAPHHIYAKFGIDPHTFSIPLTSGNNAELGYGSSFIIKGNLLRDGVALAGHEVHLLSAIPGKQWTPTTYTTTSGPGGAFSFAVKPSSKTYYQVEMLDPSGYGASVGVYATPQSFVSTPVAPPTMSRASSYNVFGYLKPKHVAGSYPVRIYKWRYVSGVWKSDGYITARASDYSTYSKYSRSIRLPYAGRWRIRAYAPADDGHAAASSGYDYVTVN